MKVKAEIYTQLKNVVSHTTIIQQYVLVVERV